VKNNPFIEIFGSMGGACIVLFLLMRWLRPSQFVLCFGDTGLITSLLTSKFEYAIGGLIAGEYVRNLKFYYENLQVRKSKLKSAIRNLDNGKSLEENALELSEHWGSGMPFN